ncbi:MAG: aminopeptidase P family protein [Synergistaceae bacterium]|nr:aminopeptidase P family protein [Synergistaceae bacterium]
MNTDIITSRTDKLRALMSAQNLDAFVLLVEERANSESCHYISGFRGSSAALIITPSASTLITDGRYTTQAKSQTPFTVIIQSELSLPAFIAKAVSESDFVRVGFEAEKISHATFTKHFAPAKAEWLDASDMIPSLRRTKDAHEVELIRRAGRIGRDALGAVMRETHAGMTEAEFGSKLMQEIKRRGAEKGWAHDDFIVASGTRSAMCHALATEKQFAEGETVTVDYGAMVEGYMSDITRNFAIGRIDDKAREINAVLLRAHREAASALRPGIAGKDVDAVARKVIADAGYGENFVHGLGHGLGLEVHEAPRLSKTSKDVLKAGDVVTIEPGIYIEGWGGLRIEDDYLITEDGAECLTVRDNQSIEYV